MKLTHKIFITAGVMVSLTCCQKENYARTATESYRLSTVTAAPKAEKTNIESDLSVSWSTIGEVIKYAELAHSWQQHSGSVYDSDSDYSVSKDGKTATFSFDVATKSADYYYVAMLYPASSYSGHDAKKNVLYVNVPGNQNAEATSADPAASLTGWSAYVDNTQPKQLQADMHHLVAYGKMTLKNCPVPAEETVNSVEFRTNGKKIAGGMEWWLEEEEGIIYGQTTTEKITVNTDKLDCSGDFTVWFGCIPFEMESGDNLDISIITDKNTYTRTLTLSKALEFVQGQISKFSVDMSSATPKSGDYVKVTSAPDNWAGTYLILAESAKKVFNGTTSGKWGLTNDVTISDTHTIASTATIDKYAVVVEKVTSGYTIKVNSGSYMNWTSKDFSLGSKSETYSIALDNNSNAVINYGGYYLKYNSAGGLRAYGQNAMTSIQLYKQTGGGGGGGEATATVQNGEVYNVTSTSAYISGSYSNVTGDGKTATAPSSMYVKYGTSATSLTQTMVCTDTPTTGSGTMGIQLYDLDSSTKYYYRFVVVVGQKEFTGATADFTTESGGGGGSYYEKSWLSGYEIPATTVTLSEGVVNYNGRYCHSTVSETHGTTKACIYNTSTTGQRIVTHTFSYSSKIQRTYTILYDKDKKCALWCAFAMNKGSFPDNGVSRNDSWKYDPAIDQSWQPDLNSAYSGSYSRGHQVASEDRQTLIDQNKQTFYFSNMTPQAQSLNGGTWNALEGEVQKAGYACSGRDTLYVVTGPVFDGYFKTTTDRNGTVCAVPTHYYKCTMKCSFDASGKMTAAEGHGYLFLHDGTNAPRQNKSIDEIEKLTGFDFFANVPDDLETEAEK